MEVMLQIINIYLAKSRGISNQGIFRKIEHNNSFIIQHIDKKTQFYFRKARDDLYFAIFLSDT